MDLASNPLHSDPNRSPFEGIQWFRWSENNRPVLGKGSTHGSGTIFWAWTLERKRAMFSSSFLEAGYPILHDVLEPIESFTSAHRRQATEK